MKYSKFKKIANRKNMNLLIELDKLEQFKDGQTILVKDNRTVQKDDGFEVTPIAWTGSQLFVVCPLCGHIHIHGLAGGEYSGSRLAHCHDGWYEIQPIIA